MGRFYLLFFFRQKSKKGGGAVIAVNTDETAISFTLQLNMKNENSAWQRCLLPPQYY